MVAGDYVKSTLCNMVTTGYQVSKHSIVSVTIWSQSVKHFDNWLPYGTVYQSI